jgi:hypothetical protein
MLPRLLLIASECRRARSRRSSEGCRCQQRGRLLGRGRARVDIECAQALLHLGVCQRSLRFRGAGARSPAAVCLPARPARSTTRPPGLPHRLPWRWARRAARWSAFAGDGQRPSAHRRGSASAPARGSPPPRRPAPRAARHQVGRAVERNHCTSMPALLLNSSAARFCVLPMLMLPMLSLPGLALAYASSSASVVNGASARPPPQCRNSRAWRWAKSFTVSNGSDLNRPAVTAVPLDIRNRVWPSGSARATESRRPPRRRRPAGSRSPPAGPAARQLLPDARAVRSPTPPARTAPRCARSCWEMWPARWPGMGASQASQPSRDWQKRRRRMNVGFMSPLAHRKRQVSGPACAQCQRQIKDTNTVIGERPPGWRCGSSRSARTASRPGRWP